MMTDITKYRNVSLRHISAYSKIDEIVQNNNTRNSIKRIKNY